MQKKVLSMFLCLIAALLLTACGSGSSEEGLLLSAESGVLQDKASGTKDSGTGDLKESSGQVSSAKPIMELFPLF